MDEVCYKSYMPLMKDEDERQLTSQQANDSRKFPNLSHDELLIIYLGPYKVDRAKNYYGEHIKQN
ncbi:Uncharacterized protein OBRU01_26722 [Operophtera brumata]|uniref:Uncharacterized protein n=1 Tax=Operophtera brumata TaxID=104452 RepID=A0A0L7K2F8_OPEBR|nr:Uncharacterized protein OBRU01_26722 [Operophtera brumata]